MGPLVVEYEDEEVRAIVAFVASMKNRKGAQYGDIKNHFRWGQDKWVKHWKKAQLYLDKKTPAKMGLPYPKYFVKKDFCEEAKILLFSQEIMSLLAKGKVHEIQIPETKVEEAIKNEVERLQPMFEQVAWEEAKKASERTRQAREYATRSRPKEAISTRFAKALLHKSETWSPENFETHPLYLFALEESLRESKAKIGKLEAERAFNTIASFVNVHLVYDKTEPLPSLDERDVANLLWIMIKNVRGKIKKPWHLIVTCSIPKEAYVQ